MTNVVDNEMSANCQCKTTKPYDDEWGAAYCTKCGRIWVDTMCGNLRPTDRFASIRVVHVDGVWIGHTFFKGAKVVAR